MREVERERELERDVCRERERKKTRERETENMRDRTRKLERWAKGEIIDENEREKSGGGG